MDIPDTNAASRDLNHGLAYSHLGILTYRASAFGRCLHALNLARKGYVHEPPPPWLRRVFDAGHDAEDVAKDQLRALGHTIDREQEELHLTLGPSVGVGGHPDGFMIHDTMPHVTWVLEVKSLSHEKFGAWTPDWFATNPIWQGYTWQVDTYMHATNLQCMVVMIDRDTFEMKFFPIERPFHTLGEFQLRASMIGYTDTCAGDAACPFRRMCVQDPDDNTDTAVSIDSDLGLQLTTIRNQKKVLEAKEKEIKAAIEYEFQLRLADRLVDKEGFIISRKTSQVREHAVAATTRTTITVKEGA